MVNKGKIYPTTSSGSFAVWDETNRPLTRARVKFNTISASYMQILMDISEDTRMKAIVPFSDFLTQLKVDDNVKTHILTKEWLEAHAAYKTEWTITEPTDYDIEIVYKRPIVELANEIGEFSMRKATVDITNLKTYYFDLSYENASTKNDGSYHPVYTWGLDKLRIYTMRFGNEEPSRWLTSDMEAEWQEELKQNVVNLKGVCGFGRFNNSRQTAIGLANETFLTLGLAEENYSFRLVKMYNATHDADMWYYVISFKIAYMTPDIQLQVQSDLYPAGLSWYIYPIWGNSVWDRGNNYSAWVDF